MNLTNLKRTEIDRRIQAEGQELPGPPGQQGPQGRRAVRTYIELSIILSLGEKSLLLDRLHLFKYYFHKGSHHLFS